MGAPTADSERQCRQGAGWSAILWCSRLPASSRSVCLKRMALAVSIGTHRKQTTPSSKGIGTTLYDGGPSGGGLPECCFLIRWREGGLLFAVRLIIDVARAGVRIAPRNRTKRARAGNQQTPPNAVVRSSPNAKC